MKNFPASQTPRAILFDIDNTLYRHNRYVFLQGETLIRRLAEHRGEPLARTKALVGSTRKQIAVQTGRKPSLGNTFVALGVPISTSVSWRNELMRPEDFLAPDSSIQTLLRTLSDRYRIGAITNNPREVGRRTLAILGVEEYFHVLVGLDTTMQSKPSWEPFAYALDALDVTPDCTVVVGDRYEVDLEPLIRRGGGGILIETYSDLALVPDILAAEI